ncbi:hypothetical protein VIH_002992 [Vibrio cholerae CT 5369-93]|nr:hypothetical protein VIH_003071 [Vibrio cholerae CT 5369-93]EEY50132.1 hypothetical protein VIH_002992 [Vibrio cholerae CT 5369-93]
METTIIAGHWVLLWDHIERSTAQTLFLVQLESWKIIH